MTSYWKDSNLQGACNDVPPSAVPLILRPMSSTKQWGRWGGYCLTGTRHKYIPVASSSAPPQVNGQLAYWLFRIEVGHPLSGLKQQCRFQLERFCQLA
jgi:hypothetical protein